MVGVLYGYLCASGRPISLLNRALYTIDGGQFANGSHDILPFRPNSVGRLSGRVEPWPGWAAAGAAISGRVTPDYHRRRDRALAALPRGRALPRRGPDLGAAGG